MAPSHEQWLIPFAIQLIPAGLLFLGLWIVRESPRWLMVRGKREHALRNLCWLRKLDANHIYVLEEVIAIDEAIEAQKRSGGIGFNDPFRAFLKSRSLQYRLFLGTSLFFWQNASSINAINYYVRH